MSEREYVEDKNGVIRKRKTHCKHGHKFDGTEVWHTNWRGFKCRVCRECARARMQRKRENPNFKANEAAKQAHWRRNNQDEYRRRYQAEFDRKRQILLDARAGGCVRCGEKHPACLDFHHRDGKESKLGNIGQFRKFGTDRLLAEIAKCDVLCANCHRKHHYDERGQKKRERLNGHLLQADSGLQPSADDAVRDV